MQTLTKMEYQILIRFYQINEVMTKNEFIEKNPELNTNTVVVGISNLHKKGYLKVAKICQTRTSLSYCYRPKLSMTVFYERIFGPAIVEHIIEKWIQETKDRKLLGCLLAKVQKARSGATQNEEVVVQGNDPSDSHLYGVASESKAKETEHVLDSLRLEDKKDCC